MSLSQFDDSRIKDHPDKQLLERIRKYYAAFTTGDFNGIRNVESKNYTMTNISKRSSMNTAPCVH